MFYKVPVISWKQYFIASKDKCFGRATNTHLFYNKSSREPKWICARRGAAALHAPLRQRCSFFSPFKSLRSFVRSERCDDAIFSAERTREEASFIHGFKRLNVTCVSLQPALPWRRWKVSHCSSNLSLVSFAVLTDLADVLLDVTRSVTPGGGFVWERAKSFRCDHLLWTIIIIRNHDLALITPWFP